MDEYRRGFAERCACARSGPVSAACRKSLPSADLCFRSVQNAAQSMPCTHSHLALCSCVAERLPDPGYFADLLQSAFADATPCTGGHAPVATSDECDENDAAPLLPRDIAYNAACKALACQIGALRLF